MIDWIFILYTVVRDPASASSVGYREAHRGQVCYPPHGCFNNAGKFAHMQLLPQSPSELNTTFTLYQPNNMKPTALNEHNIQLLLNRFLSEVYFLVHGFGNYPPWITPMMNELINKNVSVIIVDWTAGSHFPNYIQAASNTRIVGSILAEMLKLLVNKQVLDAKDITLVGFSLGAHVCGFAGKRFRNVSKIIALDPAGPLFASSHPAARLDSSDANFVQCLHTNGLSFFHGGFGTLQPMGHLDFYPNGGLVQIGCVLNVHQVWIDLWKISETLFERLTCSHTRAAELFTETIRRAGSERMCKFESIACDSSLSWLNGACFRCAQSRRMLPMFGFEMKSLPDVRGQFYFSTLGLKDNDFYCGNQYGISVYPDREVKGSITITAIFKSGLNDTFVFLKENEILKPSGVVSTKLFALSEPFAEVDRVMLFYQRYSSWVWKSGPTEWLLKSANVTSLSCKHLQVKIEQLVVDRVPLEIKMSSS